MQCVAFYTSVRLFDAAVGVVRGTDPDFVTAGKAETRADTVFEQEGSAQILGFYASRGKHGDTDTGLDIRLDATAAKLINEHWGKRQTVIAGPFVAGPIGISAVPITGQTSHVALKPTFVPIKLQANAVGLGRFAGLPDRKFNASRLRANTLPHQCGRKRSQTE